VTRPATGAVMIEYERLVSASFWSASADLTCVSAALRCVCRMRSCFLSGNCVCLRASKRDLPLPQVRGRLLDPLLGARAGLHELEIPGVFLLGASAACASAACLLAWSIRECWASSCAARLAVLACSCSTCALARASCATRRWHHRSGRGRAQLRDQRCALPFIGLFRRKPPARPDLFQPRRARFTMIVASRLRRRVPGTDQLRCLPCRQP
jgi:hypothetical protein